MQVSIIIVNYNTYQLVVNCIESIYSKTEGISFEIIVVDNNSKEVSILGLNTIFPDVHLIQSNENSGFGSGNNLGAKKAKGKYLFFLNSDTLLINNAIFYMFQFMEFNRDVGICGGNLFNMNNEPTLSFERRFPSVLNDLDRLFYFLFGRILWGKSISFNFEKKPLYINGYISGADLFVDHDLFLRVGGFDEDFFMYYEETELTHRIKSIGYNVVALNDAEIIHLEGGSQSEISSLKREWIKSSRSMYFRKTKTKGLFLSNFIQQLTVLRDRLLK